MNCPDCAGVLVEDMPETCHCPKCGGRYEQLNIFDWKAWAEPVKGFENFIICPKCNGKKCGHCANMGIVEKRGAKYKNEKTELDGHIFDSKKEADFYSHLKICERVGVVTKIELQPRFLLVPAGNGNRKMEYVADFRVGYSDGSEKIIDVKGYVTQTFKLKKKLFNQLFPDTVLEIVSWDNKQGWVSSH